MKKFADKESRNLQAEADAKATPSEVWQDGMWLKGMRFKEESKCDFCENTKLAAVYRPKDGRPMCACEDHVEIVMEAMERGGIL